MAGADPMAVVIAAEIVAFREARRTDPIVARSLELAARCDMPAYYAWLLAANFLVVENQKLREKLLDR